MKNKKNTKNIIKNTNNIMKNIINIPISVLIFIIILHIVIYFKYGSSIFLNYNTNLTLLVWIFAIYLAGYTKNNYLLLLPILLLCINEFLFIYANMDIFYGQARTKMFYDITTTYFIKENNNNTNLTDGLYIKNNDMNQLMTLDEARQMNIVDANENKYIKLLHDLNIDKSEYQNIKILDMGCGNGDFIKYCMKNGIKASGLSISTEQVKELKKQNLDVYLGSYRDLQKEFIGKYDIVTFWGSLEHITDGYPGSKKGEKKAKGILSKMMGHIKQYYKPRSDYKYLVCDLLHINKKYLNTIDSYILERTYAGWYFYDEPGETFSELIKKDNFQELYVYDVTYHYYLATKVDKTHFGNPRNTDLYSIFLFICGFFVNPQISAMIIYGLRGEWMWQFDGKTHSDDTCRDCNFEYNRSNRPTTLLWSVSKLN